jgi:hypothetical protein
VPDVVVGTSLRVRDALHCDDGNAMCGSNHAHAWAIILAQRGKDRGFDVSSYLRPTQLLALVPGPPQARAHPLLDVPP